MTPLHAARKRPNLPGRRLHGGRSPAKYQGPLGRLRWEPTSTTGHLELTTPVWRVVHLPGSRPRSLQTSGSVGCGCWAVDESFDHKSDWEFVSKRVHVQAGVLTWHMCALAPLIKLSCESSGLGQPVICQARNRRSRVGTVGPQWSGRTHANPGTVGGAWFGHL